MAAGGGQAAGLVPEFVPGPVAALGGVGASLVVGTPVFKRLAEGGA